MEQTKDMSTTQIEPFKITRPIVITPHMAQAYARSAAIRYGYGETDHRGINSFAFGFLSCIAEALNEGVDGNWSRKYHRQEILNWLPNLNPVNPRKRFI